MSAERLAEIMADSAPEPVQAQPERTIQQAVIDHARSDLSAMLDAPVIEERVQEQEGHKIGEGHLAAMIRLGGHEITQALQAFPDSNISPIEEPGVFGNPTQQLVTQEMGGIQDILDSPAIGPQEQGKSFSIDDILQASPTPQQPQEMEQQHERGGLEM